MKYSGFPFLLLTISCYSQTAVIAKKTKDAIYVGADSRMVHKRISTTGIIIEDTLSVCKIIQSGKYNFAVTGAFIKESEEMGKKMCVKYKNFKSIFNAYKDSFLLVLASEVEKLRKENIAAFRVLKQMPGSNICTAIFFAAEKDSLFLEAVAFGIFTPETQPVDIVAMNGSQDLFCAGHVAEIIPDARKAETWKNGEKNTINTLIRKAMKFHPKEVGGAIDILKVTTTKTTWLQRKKMCN